VLSPPPVYSEPPKIIVALVDGIPTLPFKPHEKGIERPPRTFADEVVPAHPLVDDVLPVTAAPVEVVFKYVDVSPEELVDRYVDVSPEELVDKYVDVIFPLILTPSEVVSNLGVPEYLSATDPP
jgi:hypothetical protein